jgi:hypothetical protein
VVRVTKRECCIFMKLTFNVSVLRAFFDRCSPVKWWGHKGQRICIKFCFSLEKTASETYEMSLSLGVCASQSVCNISSCAMSMSCSLSLLLEDNLVLCTWKIQNKTVLHVWHIETSNCEVLCSVH